MPTPPLFTPHQTILFQGDSITDAGRNREDTSSPYGLGSGYAMMAASRLQALFPECQWTFLNRGIGGNRVPDLETRWQTDCLDLKPDWVSILIGINDTNHALHNEAPLSVTDFETGLKSLLTQVRDTLQAGIILCEPFLLPTKPELDGWRKELDPRIQALRRLAREYGARYVPFDGLFASAATQRSPEFWCHDGIHPSPQGHALMAEHWLRTVGVTG